MDGPLRPAGRAAAARARRRAPRVDRVLVVDCPEDEQVASRHGAERPCGRRGARDHGDAALRAPSGSRRPTTSSTTAAPRRRSRRRSRHSTGAIATGRASAIMARDAEQSRAPATRLEAECRIDMTPRAARSVIRYEHPLNERIRTLMRLEDLFARVSYFAAQDARARSSRGARLRCSRSPTSPRAPISRPTSLQELERQKQLLAPLRAQSARSSTQRARSRCWPTSTRVERAAARADGQGRRAPARQRMADDDQAAHGDSRRRLRVRPARRTTTGCTASRRARQNDLDGWIEPFVPIYDGARDRPAAAARQRPRQPADGLPRRVPADADDDEGRAAPAAHRCRATCPACPRSARTSTRSTSASSASPAWTAARCTTTTSSSS